MRHRAGIVWPATVGVALALAGAACSADVTEVDGEVVTIDAAKNTVTLNHAAIANLQMPAMTMTFVITDPAALAGLKEGDKIRFTADWVNGTIAVTSIHSK